MFNPQTNLKSLAFALDMKRSFLSHSLSNEFTNITERN